MKSRTELFSLLIALTMLAHALSPLTVSTFEDGSGRIDYAGHHLLTYCLPVSLCSDPGIELAPARLVGE